MAFVPCAVEVLLQGRKVKPSATQTGIRIGSNGLQVIGAMSNQVLRPGSILNVAAPLAHEGRLTCTMKSSGTLLILSQLDQSQTMRLLREFSKMKAQIIGLKMAAKRPLEDPSLVPPKKATLGSVESVARPMVGLHGSTNSSSGQKRPLVGVGLASSSTRKVNAEQARDVPTTPTCGLNLFDLPEDMVDIIDSFFAIPRINKMWLACRRRQTTMMSVNGGSATALTGQAVVRFLRMRPYLKDVEILGVPLFSAQLRTIVKDVPHFTNLQRLILRKCINITDPGLASILKASRQLSVLDIVECPKISTASFEHSIAPLERLACGSRKASTRFNDIMFTKSMKFTRLAIYNSSALSGMALNWFPLTYLDVRACNLNDEAAKLISTIDCLRHLNIAENTRMTELGVSCITVGCKLETLDISDLPVDFTDFAALKDLQRIKISSCQEMREGEVVAKGNMHALRLLEMLPALTHIDVSYIDMGAYPDHVLSRCPIMISGFQERHSQEFLGADFIHEMKNRGFGQLSICPRMRHVFAQELQPFTLP